ncbi:MAG: AAA family ATPase, partial [Chloroflexi bacterium]|nr:AAA family ATPase [Chloroflexota bacterium]
MKCPNCQTTNPDGAKFCLNCGNALSLACPSCGTPYAPGAKFCHNCGHALAPPPAPGGTIAPGAKRSGGGEGDEARLQKFIPKELAAKLESARANRSMEGERRIVTILFCDVKGSTALAEQLDPEEWAEIMNSAFKFLIEPVYRYEGTLARLMGDAILAFFGAPIAHEDDPQRAALAGLGIVEGIGDFRERMKRERGLDFNVRVGINTGLVVVGEVGSDMRVEYTAMGDAVNVASRMEQTAQPGTVQIAANTYKLIAPLFEFEPLGDVEVKGKSEPVMAYRVIAPKAQPGRLRGIAGLDSPLVGREEEMDALRRAVGGLLEGRGQIVSVMGEAGLGKSRLVAELRGALIANGISPLGAGLSSGLQSASGEPGDSDVRYAIRDTPSAIFWHEGRSLSYETSTPYAPFISLFADILGIGADETDAAKHAKVKARATELLPGRVADIAPLIATMLGIQFGGEDLERVKYLEPPQLREKSFHAVRDFFERLAGTGPLVLVFEDLHWADSTSLDLLEYLLPLTDRAMLAIVALFRPQRQEPSWRFHETAARDYAHRYTSLALEPLDEQQSRELVANLLHVEDLPEKVRALILKKSEGNPFFVEEVIRSLLDAKLVVRENSHWRATREIVNITLPDTLAGVITARLDRLDDGSKRTAQTAAVIGREFQFDTLAQVYDARPELDGALGDLQRRELIREKMRVPQPVYQFKHVLTQETAYASLLLSKRRELHRRVAECLERTDKERVNDIARHFLEAHDTAKALPYLVEAGDRAARAYSMPEAI